MIEAPRANTVCSTTICGAEVLVVPDMRQDPRFENCPMVVGGPRCRFYCGVPLITDEGYALGTLCVMDFEPRRDERFVDSVARDRVEGARRVADDERAASREHRWRAAHRQAVAADIRQPPELDSVLFAEDAEMLPKVRTLLPPPADADVDMVGLGKDPPVPAGDRGELEEKHAPPVSGRKLFVRKVALESDPVDDRAAQSERARGDSVGAKDRAVRSGPRTASAKVGHEYSAQHQRGQ